VTTPAVVRAPGYSVWKNRISFTLLVLAVVELFLFGVIGFLRRKDSFSDWTYYHAAGRALLARENPYDPPTFKKYGEGRFDIQVGRYYYPPQAAPLMMLFGVLPYKSACVLMRVVNFLASLVMPFLAVAALRPRTAVAPAAGPAVPWLLPAMILGDPWLVSSVWNGTVAPLITIALMGGWLLVERGRPALAGILFGLATIKPQLAVLVMIWMVCERRWKVLAVSSLTVLVCMAYPLAVYGPKVAIGGWLANARLYQDEWCNSLGWIHLMGLPNLVFALGITLPDLKLAAVILTIALWFGRRRFCPEDILGILTGMSVTLLLAHDYDLVLLVPLLVSMWRHLSGRPRQAAVALVLVLILMIPDRWILHYHPHEWIYQRCTVITIVLLLWLIGLSVRRAAELNASPPPLAPAPTPAAAGG